MEWMNAERDVSKREICDLKSHRVSVSSTQIRTDAERILERCNLEGCTVCLSNIHSENSFSCHDEWHALGRSLFDGQCCACRKDEVPAAFAFGFEGDQYGSMTNIVAALPGCELSELRARLCQSS